MVGNSSLTLEYWDNYDRLADVYYIVVGTCISIIGILGTFGNSIVVIFFIRCRRLQTIPNYFLLNLAVADLISSLIGFPWMAAACFIGSWPFGAVVCQGYAFIVGISGFASIGSLALVSIDRCQAITKAHPSCCGFSVLIGSRLSSSGAKFAILCVWLYSGALTLPPLFGWNSFVLDGMEVSCTFDYLSQDRFADLYILFIFCLGFVIPLAVIIVSYAVIFIYLKSHETMFTKRSHTTGLRVYMRKSTDMQLAKVALVVVALFCIAWLPYGVLALSTSFGNIEIGPLTQVIAAVFAKASAVYNPIVYTISHPIFKKEIIRKFSQTFSDGMTPEPQYKRNKKITRCSMRRQQGENCNVEMVGIDCVVDINVNMFK